MKQPATWSELLANQPTTVDPSHELRPLADDVVQYVEGKAEYIAVRSPEGYGEAAEETPYLLERERVGQDFSIYRVPPYLVSIPAVTREFQDRGLESLKPVYRAIGRLLYEAANTMTVSPPMVTVRDLAVNPRTGALFYLPPLRFSAKEISHKAAYEQWMNASIARTFGSLLTQRTIQKLQAEVTMGAAGP
jgi:hypothetical protein